ncbi:MAG: MFS transporter [Firmicutes bacterium]|nr:MFS transporter [Bacillota bacterium]
MDRVTNRRLVVALMSGMVLIPLNSTMIAVGLVPIARGVHQPLSTVVWVVTVYLIVMAAFQPIAGKLGDLLGHHRLYLAGLGLFFLSSTAAALIPHLWAIIAFRAGQALSGACVTPNAMAIIRRAFDQNLLRRALSWVSLTQGLGAAFGPLVGSLLIHWAGWPAMFWVNVPVLALSLALSWRRLPRRTPAGRERLDYLGSGLLALLLGVSTLTASKLGRTWPLTDLVITVFVILGALFVRERRYPHPVIDLTFFRRRAFVAANLAILLNNFLMYSTLLYMPVYLREHRASTLMSGFLLFLFSFAMSCMSWVGGFMTRYLSGRQIIAGAFALSALVVLWYAGLTRDTTVTYVTMGMVVAGVATGIATVAIQSTLLESVSKQKAGAASGIYSTFRYLGSISAATLLTLMLASAVWHGVIILFVSLVGLWITRFIPAGSREAPRASVSTH